MMYDKIKNTAIVKMNRLENLFKNTDDIRKQNILRENYLDIKINLEMIEDLENQLKVLYCDLDTKLNN